MGKRTFIKADFNVCELVASTIALYHVDLAQVEVTIETMMVFGARNKDGHRTGPAISSRGYPAAGQIRITKLEERVAGRGDAVMWLDGDRWSTWDAIANERSLITS